MSVFISWSGQDSISHRVAHLLRDWLPKVIQRLPCYLSSNDIDAGALWTNDLFMALDTSTVGIICLTEDNLQKPWVHFEAGALATKVEKARVCPLLIGLSPDDVRHPLAAFNLKTTAKKDVFDIMRMINDSRGDQKLQSGELEEAFEDRWDRFASELEKILTSDPEPHPSRRPDMPAMVSEILATVRLLADSASRDQTLKSRNSSAKPPNSTAVWEFLLSQIRSQRPLIRGWVEEARAHYILDNEVSVWFPPDKQLARESVERPNNRKIIDNILSEFGLHLTIRDDEIPF
ncbi:MAG: TIR domain-containing protein [Chthoniobacteraceae bacterium]